MPQDRPQDHRRARIQGNLTAPRIVFMVIAAASPLAVVVATLPLAFALGAGAAQPAMYVVAGLILLFFSVGYAAMSRHVAGAGGLYVYVARGLGPFAAVIAGFVALLAYTALTIMLIGTFSYFTHEVAAELGLELPWPVWAVAVVAVVGLIGYRRIDASAKVLGVLVCTELAVIAIADVVFVAHDGTRAFPLEAFDFSGLAPATIGIGLMFAFSSFLGFEAAALYSEESKNPARTVPLATYASVAIIAVIYGLTSWIATGVIGPDEVRSTASADPGNLIFDLVDQHLGHAASGVMAVLLLTSLFATLLACHNSANRLTFALARHRVLPAGLAHVHRSHGSPSVASLVQSAVSLGVVIVCAAADLDPYVTLAASMSGLGTLCLVGLQALTSLAIFMYFRGQQSRRLWAEALSPLLALVGLTTASILIVANFSSLVDNGGWGTRLLPAVALAVVLTAAGHAMWMKGRHPQRYADIALVPLDRATDVCTPPGEKR